MNERESIEISEKLRNEFDSKYMTEEILSQFEKYELKNKLRIEARRELKKAEFFLNDIEIDTTKIQPLTTISNI